MVDCSPLLREGIDSNDTAFIELEYDKSTIFDADLSFNQASFWWGVLALSALSVIVSSVISLVYYPHHDQKQKLRVLKELNIEPHCKKEYAPSLNANTGNIRDIDNTIFDFANIDSKSVNSILDSTLEKDSLCKHLLQFIAISTLLLASYCQFYWVISHWHDSDRSYVQTLCYPIVADRYVKCHSATKYNSAYCHDHLVWRYQRVDMDSICEQDLSAHEYVFYVDVPVYTNKSSTLVFNETAALNTNMSDWNDAPCYVHQTAFTVRAPREADGGYGKSTSEWSSYNDDCCARSGLCCECCLCCCDWNGCCYAVCIITGLTCLLSFCGLCGYKLNWNLSAEYNAVERVEMIAIDGDDERLLTVQQQSAGEIA